MPSKVAKTSPARRGAGWYCPDCDRSFRAYHSKKRHLASKIHANAVNRRRRRGGRGTRRPGDDDDAARAATALVPAGEAGASVPARALGTWTDAAKIKLVNTLLPRSVLRQLRDGFSTNISCLKQRTRLEMQLASLDGPQLDMALAAWVLVMRRPDTSMWGTVDTRPVADRLVVPFNLHNRPSMRDWRRRSNTRPALFDTVPEGETLQDRRTRLLQLIGGSRSPLYGILKYIVTQFNDAECARVDANLQIRDRIDAADASFVCVVNDHRSGGGGADGGGGGGGGGPSSCCDRFSANNTAGGIDPAVLFCDGAPSAEGTIDLYELGHNLHGRGIRRPVGRLWFEAWDKVLEGVEGCRNDTGLLRYRDTLVGTVEIRTAAYHSQLLPGVYTNFEWDSVRRTFVPAESGTILFELSQDNDIVAIARQRNPLVCAGCGQCRSQAQHALRRIE